MTLFLRSGLALALLMAAGAAVWAQPATPVRPLLFEPVDAAARTFMAAEAGYQLRLTAAGIDLAGPSSASLRVTFPGSRPVAPRPDGPAAADSHYYAGRDPKKWRIGVPNYERIRYAGIYDGIDLVFYGSEREFEYDFVVAAYADPSLICMRVTGASVAVNPNGDLVLDAAGFRLHRPRARQGTRSVEAAFHVDADGLVRFQLGDYDASEPLVIDPVIVYTTYHGGSFGDAAQDVAVDRDGNILVAGVTHSRNFPGTVVFGQTSDARQSGFVSKYQPVANGKNRLLFTILLTDLSDIGFVTPFGLAVDSDGNIILAGETIVQNFPVKNAWQDHLAGGLDCRAASSDQSNQLQTYCEDAFLAKFTPDGRQLVFSTYYGGRLSTGFQRVAVDSTGDIYAVGYQNGPTDISGTKGAVQPQATSNVSALATRFSSTGQLLYSTFLGAESRTFAALTLAVERPGVIWIGGNADGPGLTATLNAFLSTYPGIGVSGWLAHIDMARQGTAGLLYSSYFGGDGNLGVAHLFLDPTGQVVFCGGVVLDMPVTPTAMFPTFMGVPMARVIPPKSLWAYTAGDGYVARLNPALSGNAQLTYGSYVGGTDSDAAQSCATDANGNILVAGSSFSSDFLLTVGSPFPYKPPGSDPNIFLTRIDPKHAGGLIESVLTGGTGSDQLAAMAVDQNRDFAYLAGITLSKSFPVTGQAEQKIYGGDTVNFGGFTLPFVVAFGDAWWSQVALKFPQVAPFSLAAQSGDFQFAAPSTRLPSDVRVQLQDASGNPLPLSGYRVSFDGTNATPANSTVLTDGDGAAGTPITLGAAGAASVTASVSGLKDFTFHFRAVSGAFPTSVAIVSGNNQSGKPGAVLPQPLVVELRASGGPLALAGITVQFKASNATVSAANVVTDAQGRAQTNVTLGTGPVTVTVIVASLPEVVAKFNTTGPVISEGGIAHGATAQAGPVSPGLIILIYGAHIGPDNLVVASSGPDHKFATLLAGTRVLFDDTPGAMVYASSGQTSAIVPYSVGSKSSVKIQVEYLGETSNAVTVSVVAARPGLIAANSSGAGQGAILNQDGSYNSKDIPAKPLDIVVLFGTGEGETDPPGVDGLLALDVYPKPKLPVKVLINGKEAEVAYYGAAPTLVAGVLQLNVRIPPGTSDGNATVQVFVGDNASPATITVAVKGG